MAEPLKNSFGEEIPRRLAEMLEAVFPGFDTTGFLARALDGYDDLELTPRAWHIATALRPFLPDEVPTSLDVVVRSLGPEIEGDDLSGMASFLYLPFVFFVAEYGRDHFEPSMRAQYELTKRFTAEFSIRAFLEHDPERTLARLREWASDENVHVRRLVSEGTRPRLPWAPRLRAFVADPTPVLELLELLKDDPELYVRRSVANNLNDISKDHPDLVVAVAERWMKGASVQRRSLIRHGLRGLIKAGNEAALSLLGFERGSPVVVELRIAPTEVKIGGKVKLSIEISNPASTAQAVAVDFRVHFVKTNGSTSPKVFKGAELVLKPGGNATVRRSVSLAQHTTRKHHPGVHRVESIVNGETRSAGSFDLGRR